MRASQRPNPSSQFQIGDMVLIEGHLGRVVGVRYGQIAYDVILRDLVFRNIAPERVRLSSPAGRARHALQRATERPTAQFLARLRTGRARGSAIRPEGQRWVAL
jgi:hypothetical protein